MGFKASAFCRKFEHQLRTIRNDGTDKKNPAAAGPRAFAQQRALLEKN
jgi:hypothetical protein